MTSWGRLGRVGRAVCECDSKVTSSFSVIGKIALDFDKSNCKKQVEFFFVSEIC